MGLRPRRLVDGSKLDTSVELLGAKYPRRSSSAARQPARLPHRGRTRRRTRRKSKEHSSVFSTVATTSIEDVIAARGAPVWWQLYSTSDWNQTRAMIKRAEAAGAPAVVFTVDLLGGSNRETMFREAMSDTRNCIQCHAGGRPAPRQRRVDDRDIVANLLCGFLLQAHQSEAERPRGIT